MPKPASPTAFGKYLRTERKAARLSQAELGGMIGVTAAYLCQVERGQRAPMSPEHWPSIVKALPSATIPGLQRAAAASRPLEIDLGKVPAEQVDLALAFALRIRNRDLSADEIAALAELVQGGGAPVRAHGRVVDASGAPVTGRAFVYRLRAARGWSAVLGTRAHAGRAAGPLDGRCAALTSKSIELLTAKDPQGAGFFDVPGGLPPGDYALDVHLPDNREMWAWPLTVAAGLAAQDVRLVCEATAPATT
jgi:transcriptional regulator with XRE-family HTH domain